MKDEPILVNSPRGILGRAQGRELTSSIKAGLRKATIMHIVSLPRVRYLGDWALGEIANLTTRMREYGGDLKLAGVSDKMMNQIQLLGIQDRFEIHRTIDLAVYAFVHYHRPSPRLVGTLMLTVMAKEDGSLEPTPLDPNSKLWRNLGV